MQIFGEGDYAPQISAAAPGAGAGVFVGYGALRFDADLGVVAATEIALDRRAGVRGSVALTRVPLTLSGNASGGRLGRIGARADARRRVRAALPARSRRARDRRADWRFNPGALLALEKRAGSR